VVEKQWPGDAAKLRELSLVEEGPVQHLRMANLAVVGSFSVNGVAALHTALLKRHLFADFHALFPGRIQQQDQRHHPAPLAAGLQSRT
jgi:starch phosphorylase